jgi:hypothetical protein
MRTPIAPQTLSIFLPHYRTCVRRGSERLSQQHQIDELRAAVAADHPQLAQAVALWSPLQQSAVLAALARAVTERPTWPTDELWRVSRDGRELVCLAVQTTAGTDVRLMEGDELVRSTLCLDGAHARSLAGKWHRRLTAAGWDAR